MSVLASVLLLGAAGADELVVRVVAQGGFDASHLWLRAEGAAELPFTRFPPDGALTFEGVRPGRSTLFCTWPSGDACWREVNLVAGAPWVVELELEPGARRTLELRAPDGRRLDEGAVVVMTWVDGNGAACRGRAAVGAGGRARFLESGTDEGWFEVWVGGTLAGAGQARFDRSIARVALVDRSLTVRLVDERGQALRGGQVELATPDPDAPWSLRCDADARGRIELRGLAFDELLLVARHPTASTRTNLRVPLEHGGATELEIVMAGGEELAIRALDDGAPLPGVAIELHASARALFVGARHTDAEGVARWSRMERGAYQVHIEQRGLWPTRAAFEFTGEPVEVQVPSRGDLTLRAIDPERRPIPGAHATLHWRTRDGSVGDWVARHRVSASPRDLRTDSNGELELRGLPRGRYDLELTTPAGAVRRERIEVSGRAARRRTLTVR